MHEGAYEIAVDIGGTFTDWVLWEEGSGFVASGKLLTTLDVGDGFLAAVDAARRGIDPWRIRAVRHATTVAANALLEGRHAALALVTTEGFRDLLEIGRQFRPDLYDLNQSVRRPLVPRQWRIEIEERIDASGHVIVDLDENSVREQAGALAAEGCSDFVVAFVNSYVNPSHENRAAAVIRETVGSARVWASSEVWSEYREYERMSTAVVNAAVGPTVVAYVQRVAEGLNQRGITAPLLIMTSSGGLFPAQWLEDRPVAMVESGPTAGALAAASVGRELGFTDILAFDMGGTTAKVALLRNGELPLAQHYEVGGDQHGSGQGDGYPIGLPVSDLVEVGAGGGSITSVDTGGRLLVGPRSAGSAPGPVCYGRGGTEPTVTDANLILGRFQVTGSSLGLVLDPDGARGAIKQFVAEPLGLSVEDAAEAVVRVANAKMHAAIRKATIERGFDPRACVLVATGGCGPTHACELADELDIRTVIVPRHASVASATGLETAGLRWDVQKSVLQSSDESDDELREGFAYLTQEAGDRLKAHSKTLVDPLVTWTADARYAGQSYEVPVTVPINSRVNLVKAIESAFHVEHDRLYHHSKPDHPVEVVNIRATATIAYDTPPASSKRPTLDQAVHRYEDADAPVVGPIVFEHDGSTVYVPAGWKVSPERQGHLVIRSAKRRRGSGGRDVSKVATREVVKYGLEAITERMSVVVERTAHSTIIREILDYATALFTRDGRLIAQSSRIPFDHNSMSETVTRLRTTWRPIDQWAEGDIVITNDPYLGGSQHLPDIMLFMPLFHQGELVAIGGCIGHHVDVGGRVPGSYALDSSEIYEEGLRIPPTLLYEGGHRVQPVWDFIRANVRLPETVCGDLDAQVAALRTGERDLGDLILRVGLTEVDIAQEELLAYSAVRMRQQIGKLRRGIYAFEDAVDDDGKSPTAIPIRVQVSIDANGIEFDFSGSAEQRRAPINATYPMLLSSVYYVVMTLADPSIPQNDGCFVNVRVTAPEGSVVNAKAPAPVVGRVATCHRVVDTIFGALANVAPELVPAAFYGMSNMVSITGIEEGGGRWILFEIVVGGWGGRPASDGPDALSAHLHNIRNTPVEVIEQTFPLRIERFELLADSGGAGKWRGGLGTVREYRLLRGEATVTVQGDRFVRPPYGLNGGLPGRTGSFSIVKADGTTLRLPSKALSVPLLEGELLRVETQGGGGWGEARLRDRALIERDLREGKITYHHASEAYGL